MLLNSVANALGTLIPIPVVLMMVPFTLAHVGREGYGAWALVGAFVGMVQLADFGLTAAVTRTIAFHHARGERGGVLAALHSATLLFSCIGVAVFVLALLLWPLLARSLFAGTRLPLGEVRAAFLGATAVFVAALATSAFTSLLDGLQRIGLQNAIRLGSILVNAGGVWLALNARHGLRGLVEGSAASVAFRIAALLLAAPFVFPGALSLPPRVSRGELRRLTAFSSRISVVQLSGVAYYQVPKVYLRLASSLATVGLYDVVAGQMQRFQEAVTGLVYPFLPALATHSAGDGEAAHAEARALYRTAHRFMAALVVPFVALLAVIAGPFARVWLGPAYGFLGPVFIANSVGTGALILTAPAHYTLIGYARMRPDVERATLSIILALTLVWFGATRGGLLGAAAANSLTAVAALAWLQMRSRGLHVMTGGGGAILRDYARTAAACVPAALAAWAAVHAMHEGWGAIAAAVAAFVAVLLPAALALRVVTADDVRQLRSMLASRSTPLPHVETVPLPGELP